MPNRILTWPIMISHGLIDDADGRRTLVVGFVEQSAPKQRNTHRGPVTARDAGAMLCPERFAGLKGLALDREWAPCDAAGEWHAVVDRGMTDATNRVFDRHSSSSRMSMPFLPPNC